MKYNKLITLPVASLLLIFPVLLFTGCGSSVEQPISKDMGCPSGSYLANATDTITAPPDVDFTGVSFFNAPYGGGTVLQAPLQFTVNDVKGNVRNNVCLLAYTGDTTGGPGPYWYTDAGYGPLITGTGPFNARAIVTDDSGAAWVYWSSAVLPPGIPKSIASVGPPVTYSAGADQTGTSWISVYSGSQSATFNFNWTVQGEPAQ